MLGSLKKPFLKYERLEKRHAVVRPMSPLPGRVSINLLKESRVFLAFFWGVVVPSHRSERQNMFDPKVLNAL